MAKSRYREGARLTMNNSGNSSRNVQAGYIKNLKQNITINMPGHASSTEGGDNLSNCSCQVFQIHRMTPIMTFIVCERTLSSVHEVHHPVRLNGLSSFAKLAPSEDLVMLGKYCEIVGLHTFRCLRGWHQYRTVTREYIYLLFPASVVECSDRTMNKDEPALIALSFANVDVKKRFWKILGQNSIHVKEDEIIWMLMVSDILEDIARQFTRQTAEKAAGDSRSDAK